MSEVQRVSLIEYMWVLIWKITEIDYKEQGLLHILDSIAIQIWSNLDELGSFPDPIQDTHLQRKWDVRDPEKIWKVFYGKSGWVKWLGIGESFDIKFSKSWNLGKSHYKQWPNCWSVWPTHILYISESIQHTHNHLLVINGNDLAQTEGIFWRKSCNLLWFLFKAWMGYGLSLIKEMG